MLSLFKKKLSLLIVATLSLVTFLPVARADEIGFLQAAVNMASLENYKSIESFNGNFSADGIVVDYRFNFTSAVDNDVNPASFSRFNLSLSIANVSAPQDTLPFKKATANLAGQVVSEGQTDAYFRLDEVKFNVEGADQEEDQLMMDMVESFFNSFKGTWYHWGLEEMLSEIEGMSPGLVDQEVLMEFTKEFKENPEQAVTTLIEDIALSSGETLSPEDKIVVEKAVDLFFQTSFFTQKDVLTGPNTGFKFYTLNRQGVVGFIQGVSEMMGETMTPEDLLSLRAGLNKFSMAGIYRINQEKGLLDNLVTRMKLRDIEGLDHFELNYRFKLTDTTTRNSIQIPTEFEELNLIEEVSQ